MEMEKIFRMLLPLALAVLMGACSSDNFKIDGKLTGLDGVAVRIVFRGDSGIVDEWQNVDKEGRFTYQGVAANPVLVTIMNHRGDLVKALVAANGDHLKVQGDASKAIGGVKVKGNRLNEDWQLFIDEHLAFYNDPNPSRLDAAIEKYVREHPDDMLSTVLLANDYSDYSDHAKMDMLLKSIEAKARPQSLAASLTDGPTTGRKPRQVPRLMSLMLIKHGGDFEEITLTGHRTLLSLWAMPQQQRSSLADKLQALDPSVSVIDILAESDTMRWHQAIASDPKSWRHYWSPGGPLEPGIQLLGITSMPWFAVTDSTGLVIYSGPSIDKAIKSLPSN